MVGAIYSNYDECCYYCGCLEDSTQYLKYKSAIVARSIWCIQRYTLALNQELK